jgi:2-polyprenyl-3-methyl-5-hydroxy-6-metoxy-1,4-benzoquinol methylase
LPATPAFTIDTSPADRPVGMATMSAAMPEAHRFHEWVYRSFADLVTGRTLEVGSGTGVYTEKLLRHGAVVAADVDRGCLDAVRDRCQSEHLDCVELDLDRPEDFAPLRDRPFDTVVSINVLEHIAADVAAVQNLSSVLRPGGRLILYVPAMPCLHGTLDEAAGHHRRYTLPGLRTLVEAAGHCVIRARYMNAVSAVGWWINGRLIKQRDLSARSMSSQIRLYDRFLLPLTRLVDQFASRFFGQSLLVVGEKI